MPELSEVKVKVTTEADGRGLDEAEKKIAGFSKNAVNASMFLTGGFIAAGTAMVGAGLKSIQMGAQFEQSQVAFTQMLGSAEKSDAFLKQLFDFAAKTPFEFTGLQDASRRLLAYGFEANEIIPIMTRVGDAVSALGGGTAEINRATLALGQMQAKGKVSGEEMRQLAELGIPVWDMLAKKIGTSIPEAMKLSEKGAIDAQTGINAVLDGMGQKFAGGMDKQSKTVLGLWSTLKDTLSQTLVKIGTKLIETFHIQDVMSGAITALGGFADVLINKVIPFLEKNSGLIPIVAGTIFAMMVPALWAMATAAWAALVPILAFAAPFIAIGALVAALYLAWNNNFLGIRDIVAGFVAWFQGAVTAIGTFFGNVWTGIQTAITNFLNWVNTVLVPAFTLAFQILSFPLIILWDIFVLAWAGISWVMQKFLEWIGATFGPSFNAGMNFIKNILDVVGKFFGTIWDAITNTLKKFGDWLHKTFSPIIASGFESIQTMLTNLKKFWENIWNGISSFVKGIAEGIIGFVKSMINGLIDLFNGLIKGANKVGEKVGGFIKIPEIPHLAAGTDNFSGGTALVGENGPELVYLPRGSQVIPNNRLGEQAGNGVTVNQTNYIQNDIDVDYMLRNLAYAVANK